MSGVYRTAQICLNGHCITSSADVYPQHQQNFCDQCGAPTIMECPACHTPIRGYYDSPGVIGSLGYDVPAYCYHCGKQFPWTESAMEAVAALVMEDEDLQDATKKALVDSLPDVISETPKTNLAVVRVKKALLSAGKFTVEGLRQFAIDFGCELVKKQLGL